MGLAAPTVLSLRLPPLLLPGVASLPPDFPSPLHFQADNHRGRGTAGQRTERHVHRDQREDRLQREAGENTPALFGSGSPDLGAFLALNG